MAQVPNNGTTREDGTKKGLGFFGKLNRPDNNYSTELSMGVNFDGEERLIPTIVPTLKPWEVQYLLMGAKPTPEIMRQAVEHARLRRSQGKGAFAETGEQIDYNKYRKSFGK